MKRPEEFERFASLGAGVDGTLRPSVEPGCRRKRAHMFGDERFSGDGEAGELAPGEELDFS